MDAALSVSPQTLTLVEHKQRSETACFEFACFELLSRLYIFDDHEQRLTTDALHLIALHRAQ